MAETGYNLAELISMIQDALTAHLPSSSTWIPGAIMGGFVLFGLVLLVRGAKFAPVFMCIAMAGAGAYAGTLVANNSSLAMMPAVAVGSLVGSILGIALFRVALAASVGVLAMVAGVAAFGMTGLRAPLSDWGTSATSDEVFEVTIPSDETATVASSRWAELNSLWGYLAAEVPNFQKKFYGILGSTGLAGLLFGWLMPRGARAFWAATLGVLVFGAGLQRVLDTYAQDVLFKIEDHGQIAWIVVGVVWLISFIVNFRGISRRRKPVVTLDDEGGYQPATA